MVFQAFKKVFIKTHYVFLAAGVAVTTFVLAVLLPNFSLIKNLFKDADLSLGDKINLPISLLGSITTNFNFFSASYTIIISVLLGINVAILVFFLRRRVKEVKETSMTTGALGMISGIIGIGCAACGSLIITSVLSIFGAGWLVTYLPFAGAEFGILGILLLGFSIYTTSKRIMSPSICKV